VDRAAGTLEYVNAGHPPAFVLPPDGGPRRLVTGGSVIGLGRETDFEEGVLSLSPGDRLVLYTDGVTEAARPAREEFGEARVVSHLARARTSPAAEAAAGLIDAAAAFAGGTLADDATAVVVTVE